MRARRDQGEIGASTTADRRLSKRRHACGDVPLGPSTPKSLSVDVK